MDVDLLNRLQIAFKALWAAEEMLRNRDEMNGRIHMGETRLSPLTMEVQAARSLIQDVIVSHIGQDGIQSLKTGAYGGNRP